MALHTEKKADAPKTYQVTRAKCGQCGRELRYVPFMLNNIMCRECYGLDRYRRAATTSWVPEKAIETTVTDEESTTTTSS
jgi:hypothetical protein